MGHAVELGCSAGRVRPLVVSRGDQHTELTELGLQRQLLTTHVIRAIYRFHASFMSSLLGSIGLTEPWHHAADLARSGGRVRPLLPRRGDCHTEVMCVCFGRVWRVAI